ncbi:hypothetical protein [Helicobacter rodentium]|uniref:hypothetical protein n=1 Tax=Helicobacter rodentium TaxID=59617 RepID=UPI002578A2FA|nr:hypothetical protein [Helicobacter rodentium]
MGTFAGWGPWGTGLGAAGGNWLGNEFAEFSSDFVYDFIQRIQSIGTTNPRLTLADIKLVEALFDQYTQKDSIQSNKQDRISCLQPTISQSPNLTNKNISVSFRSAISSKTTQNPKDETLNLKNQISTKGQTMNPNFLTLLLLYILIH